MLRRFLPSLSSAAAYARVPFIRSAVSFQRPFSRIQSYRAFSSTSDSEQPIPGANAGKDGGLFVMAATCSKCSTRFVKQVTKNAYFKGVVIVQCPGCKSLHLIADHLGWYSDKGTHIEQILAERGESIRVIQSADVMQMVVDHNNAKEHEHVHGPGCNHDHDDDHHHHHHHHHHEHGEGCSHDHEEDHHVHGPSCTHEHHAETHHHQVPSAEDSDPAILKNKK
eukprot:GILJ01003933.1.p1 GENE.GILJ01003933.1~~GILJ01003933.1.p1  ORF type:complete len:223 (-),score=24.22 GILJ01003933.1:94-762(-)